MISLDHSSTPTCSVPDCANPANWIAALFDVNKYDEVYFEPHFDRPRLCDACRKENERTRQGHPYPRQLVNYKLTPTYTTGWVIYLPFDPRRKVVNPMSGEFMRIFGLNSARIRAKRQDWIAKFCDQEAA